MTTIEDALNVDYLSLASPQMEDLWRERADDRPLSIFYGETFDAHGITVDSLKYYFVISEIAEFATRHGHPAAANLLIADSATLHNVPPAQQDRYKKLALERKASIERICDIYHLPLTITLMSDYVGSDQFLARREGIIARCESDGELRSLIEATVPEEKRYIERMRGYLYSYDEIATILDVDIKVGPPREDLYDAVAQRLAADEGRVPLRSVLLRPTQPLGLGWDFFFAHPEMESYGVTPYKAGNKNLQDHRIIVGRSDREAVASLLKGSYSPRDMDLPNPVLDTGVIAEMAMRRLTRDRTPISLATPYARGRMLPSELAAYVSLRLNESVLERFS